MQAQYLTNQLYDAQAWWIRDVILGKIKLPGQIDMSLDITSWKADGDIQKTNMEKINFQARYLKNLWEETNCPRFNLDAIVQIFEEWESTRRLQCRGKAFKSAIDGTVGTVANIAWSDVTLNVDEKGSPPLSWHN